MAKKRCMKKAITAIALLVVSALFAALFAACNDTETAERAKVIVVAGDGGVVTNGEIETDVGASVAEALKGVTLTVNDGFTFAGWYIEGKKVSDETVPKEGITVSAKYTVGVTVRLYKQNVDLSYGGYEEITDSGIYGESYTYTPSAEHFIVDGSKENRLSTDALNLGEVFTAYLARVQYEATLVSVKSDGTQESATIEYVYGEEATYPALPEGFESANGRRFWGWQDGNAFKKPGEKWELSGNVTLTAVWDEAYIDRAGGGDYIYLLQGEAGVAVLDRAGFEFSGTVDADGEFTFTSGDSVLKGKANGNGTFMYAGVIVAGTYTHYDNHYGVQTPQDSRVTLTVDEYGEGTLTSGVSYEGVVYIDPQFGDYVFSVDESKAFYFTCGKLDDALVFSIQSNEFGTYVEFVSVLGFLNGYEGDGRISLDGYGNAVFYDSYHKEYYYGTYGINSERSFSTVTCVQLHMYNEDGYIFGESDNSAAGTYRDRTVYLIDLGEVTIYVYEDESGKGEFTSGSDKLTLDGFGGFAAKGAISGKADSAVYEHEGQRNSGSYYCYESDLFGKVVEMTDFYGNKLSFALSKDEKTFKYLGSGITEFINLYSDPDDFGRSSFGGAILVMHEKQGDSIPTDVYCKVDGEYVLVGSGTCTVEERGGGILIYHDRDAQGGGGGQRAAVHKDRLPRKRPVRRKFRAAPHLLRV